MTRKHRRWIWETDRIVNGPAGPVRLLQDGGSWEVRWNGRLLARRQETSRAAAKRAQ